MSLADEYLTTGQAAAALGVTIRTVKNRIAAGCLRAERVGTYHLVERASVEELLGQEG